MRVWTNVTFRGHWPVGTAAIVVAETAERAAYFLNKQLDSQGLRQVPPIPADEMVEVDTTKVNVVILLDGEY